MIKVFVLFWFMLAASGESHITTSTHTNLEKCREVAKVMFEDNQKAKDEGKMLNFGGTCREISVWSNLT